MVRKSTYRHKKQRNDIKSAQYYLHTISVSCRANTIRSYADPSKHNVDMSVCVCVCMQIKFKIISDERCLTSIM